jgi:hypothetical protein
MSEQATSLDLDGVIFSRPPIQITAVFGYMLHGNGIYEPVRNLSDMERSVVDEPITSFFEKRSYKTHASRKLAPDAHQFIEQEANERDIYGNTGRRNKKNWVDMTKQTLDDEKVLRFFKDFFFKPKGVRTVESKGAAISQLLKRYKNVKHVDDNPADVLPLAKIFPMVQFFIVQDLTTGLLFSRIEIKEYPNVKRVPRLLSAVLK